MNDLAADQVAPVTPAASAPAAPAPAAPRRGRLFRKYALSFAGLVGVVLLASGAIDGWFSWRETRDTLAAVQQGKAEAAAQRIEQFVAEIERQIGWTTHAQWAAGSVDQRRFDYVRLLRQVPAITELVQIDGQGREQLKVSRLAMDVVGGGTDYAADPRFTEARARRIWHGPVYFRKESEPYMTIAVARAGRDGGVTLAEVNLKLIWDVVTAMRVGRGGYAYVVDRDGRLIAHPDISLVLRNTDLAAAPQVAAARDAGPLAVGDAPRAVIVPGFDGRQVFSAWAPIPQLGWTVFVEAPVAEALEPLFSSLQRTLLLLALGLVVAAGGGVLFARRMLTPIRALEAGAARLGAGELDHRIDVRTGDELQALADGFNAMGGRLSESYATLERKVEARTAELQESLDHQTATSEVLNVISRSTAQLQPVLDAIVETAMRLCRVEKALIFLRRDGRYHIAAAQGVDPAFSAFLADNPIPPATGSVVGRTALEKRTVYVKDVLADPTYDWLEAARRGNFRSMLGVPLMRQGEVIGVFALNDPTVRAFSDKQVALLESFADQAVIAIENVRLFDEVQARTAELQQSLEHQTATSEVLEIISRSTSQIQPVLDAIVQIAHRLLQANYALVFLLRDGRYHLVAANGASQEYIEFLRANPIAPGHATLVGRTASERRPVYIEDALNDPSYGWKESARRGDFRSNLGVPLLRQGEVVGVLVVTDPGVRSFKESQVELLAGFADQAVIAIENVRLFDEVQARTAELQESLERQTATSDVLKAISRSTFDLGAVLDALTAAAMRLCRADFAWFARRDGDVFRPDAGSVAGPMRQVFDVAAQFGLDRGTVIGRAALERSPVQVLDVLADPEYRLKDEIAAAAAPRTILGVPLLRDGAVIGVFALGRQQMEAFSPQQIDLVSQFADQAVIAMENVRLFDEVQARTREVQRALAYQTATGEVLEVISRSPTDALPVFETIVRSAVRLCDSVFANAFRFDGEMLHYVASHNTVPGYRELVDAKYPMRPDRSQVSGRVILDNGIVTLDDARADPEYDQRVPDATGWRKLLGVPIQRDGKPIGVITVGWAEAGSVPNAQVDLLRTFADQAVIAIENVRLFDEVQARTAELQESLEQQTATSEVLRVITNSPGELAPVFDSILANAIRICDAQFGVLARIRDGAMHFDATINASPAYADYLRAHPQSPDERRTGVGRVLASRTPLLVDDAAADSAYLARAPLTVAAVELAGARSYIAVPMMKENDVIGIFFIYRREVRPFTSKHVELVSGFASQAAVAIENARLLNETREALERQTATSEILASISGSMTDAKPVFNAIVRNLQRLIGTRFAVVQLLRDDGMIEMPAVSGDSGFEKLPERYPRPLDDSTFGGQVMLSGEVLQLSPVIDNPLTPSGPRQFARDFGFDSVLFAPMTRGGKVIGAIGAADREARNFDDKQVALIKTFADQAVIAIENVRLFDEVQARTRELQESLEQQTATSQVLQVITKSPGELGPVFDSILENASRICDAPFGALFRTRDGALHVEAMLNVPPVYADYLHTHPQPLSEIRTGIGRVMASKQPVLVVDAAAEEAYRNRVPLRVAAVELGKIGTFLAVPMLKEDELVGMFVIYRTEVRTFTPKQIELASSFASQAAVAIENVRLLNEVQARTLELQKSLEQQTATSDVLKAISRSTFDLGAVLDALTSAAMRLCRADFAWFARREGDQFTIEARSLIGPTRSAAEEAIRRGASRGTLFGRILIEKRIVHIVDALADPEFDIKTILSRSGARTLLGAPLMRDGALIGAFLLGRLRVEAFSPQEVELISGFSDQAVIAMENVRLFDEVQARTRELQQSLEYQTATSDVLKAISRSTFDLSAVLNALTAAAMRLCRADFSWFFHRDGDRFRVEAGELAGAARTLAEEVASMGLTRGTLVGRTALERRIVHIVDALADAEYTLKEGADAAKVRTLLGVPLIRDGELLGVFSLGRNRVEPFSQAQIDLVTAFADQAVIAMENVRLFEEVQASTRELAQSVEELRALGEVGQTVNSTLDAPTVLQTIVAKAVELSGTDAGAIYVWSSRHQAFRMRASAGGDEALDAAMRKQKLGIDTPLLGEAAQRRETVQAPELREVRDTPASRLLLEAGYRALLVVPLIGPERAIGALILRRKQPGSFPQRTVDLMRTFAAQSVVAIQNARLFGEIEEKGRELALASQHKSQFLANMSHELRTPLNAVLGYAELMADGVYGDLSEKATGVLARIQSNGRHLLGLINDVLDLSKIEAGQLTLALDDYALPGVVQSVIAATESLASAKALKLAAEVAPGLPIGRGDERRLTQVLLNVVGNAIKFTDTGGVTIGARLIDTGFEIAVTDTGPGIAPEHQARIFEEFQQVDDSSTRKKGGSGLGLAISRKIVEMHGGAISVESQAGAGSTFRIRVPVRVEAQKEFA